PSLLLLLSFRPSFLDVLGRCPTHRPAPLLELSPPSTLPDELYDDDDHYVIVRYPVIWYIKDINITAVVDAAAKQTEEE
ncbi:hypothetical protein PENTCL1PPCAC_20914, partial [Pristionchus entomophagus]